MTGAARELTKCGIRVVLDASDNSLPKEAISTERELVLELEDMTRDVVMGIPQFKATFNTLDKAGLSDVVWHLVGGNPARLNKLEAALMDSDVDITEVVGKFLGRALADTISRCTQMLAANAELEEIIELFKTQDEVPETLLKEKHITLPSPCKVLRGVNREGEVVLVPADAYMAFVLRHDLKKAPPIEELKKMVAR